MKDAEPQSHRPHASTCEPFGRTPALPAATAATALVFARGGGVKSLFAEPSVMQPQ